MTDQELRDLRPGDMIGRPLDPSGKSVADYQNQKNLRQPAPPSAAGFFIGASPWHPRARSRRRRSGPWSSRAGSR
jgi:hypothetical protein